MVEKLSMLFRPRGFTDPAARDHQERLVAVWKLVSYESRAAEGGRRAGLAPGLHASIIFTRRGRFLAMVSDVTSCKEGEQAAAEFRAAFPFSGRYHSDAERWTTKVDHTWNDALTSDEQTRAYRFDGERLQVLSGQNVFTFEKMK